MADFTSEFSPFMKGDALKDAPRTLTILSAGIEEIGKEKQRRVVLAFKEDPLKLVVNKTNYNELTDVFGSADTDKWLGRPVTLYFDPKIEFGGKRVGGIRVRSAK